MNEPVDRPSPPPPPSEPDVPVLDPAIMEEEDEEFLGDAIETFVSSMALASERLDWIAHDEDLLRGVVDADTWGLVVNSNMSAVPSTADGGALLFARRRD